MIDYLFYIMAGMNMGSITFVMQAQLDTFDNLFEGLEFDFYVASPQYIALMTALIVSKFIQSFKIQEKLLFFSIFTVLFFSLVPILALCLAGSKSGLISILGAYYLALVGNYLVEFYVLATCSQYPSRMTVFLFIFEPGVKVTIMIVKFISMSLRLEFMGEFLSMFGYFVFLQICLVFIFQRIKSSGKLNLIEISKEVRDKGVDVSYLKAAYIVRRELSLLCVHLFVTYIVVPGVTFSLVPVTLISKRAYSSILNTLIPIFAIIGRIIANNSFNAIVTHSLLIISIIGDAFLIYAYFTNLNIHYEGIMYTVFVLHSFSFLRTACSLSYFTILAGQKATRKTKVAIGVLITFSELMGHSGGSIIAIAFPYLKK